MPLPKSAKMKVDGAFPRLQGGLVRKPAPTLTLIAIAIVFVVGIWLGNKLPALLGEPVISPVEEFMLRPLGRLEADQE